MAIGDNVLCTCKRKELRRNRRDIKKARRIAYHSHKKVEDVIKEKDGAGDVLRKKSKKAVVQAVDKISEKPTKKRRRKRKTVEQVRKERLLRAIDEDNVEIHRYEKILGYNKRKSKNMPQVFRAEGLDYLLEVCDWEKYKSNSGLQMKDSESENDEGNEMEVCSEQDTDEDVAKAATRDSDDSIFKPSTSEKEFSELKEEKDSSAADEESENCGDDVDEVDMNLKEDIYGRLVNKKTGEVIPLKLGAKQKLDELEQRAELLTTEAHMKLLKLIRGLVNRLNEHTLVGAIRSFSDIFASNSHNEVKQLLFSEIFNSLVVGYRLPDRLIIEYAVFLALIHTTVSSEISSYFIEHFVVKFLEMVAALPEGKSLENLIILLAELYNFKVIKVMIVIEIMQRLREELNDKCLSCFKVLLSYSGNTMRKRDFGALQKCITEAQTFFSELQDSSLKKQQLWYIVEEINGIKNANVRKFTDAVDFTLYDHYVSIFRGLTRKVDKERELPMSVDDIVHIPERGRWWLVGSAWLPSESNLQDRTVVDKSAKQVTKFDASLLELAKKAKMNTTVRRDIFCTLMSSTDEMDAFEKLLRLSLKGQLEREIVHICVLCALRETKYNQFYAAVIENLCCYHKRFKLTTQYALWDRIGELQKLEKIQRNNLALLVVDLLMKRSVGITVLKIIEFGAIDKLTVKFVRRILSVLLTRCTQQTLVDIFKNVVTSPQHKLFSDGLQIFIHMALKKPQKNIDNEKLLSRIELLDSIWGDVLL